MIKSILFLGGGQLGLPYLRWAKEIGFNIIVNDKRPDAPGNELADVTIGFDSTDIRGLTTWAKKTIPNTIFDIAIAAVILAYWLLLTFTRCWK